MLTGFDGDGVDESGRGISCSRAGLVRLIQTLLLVFHLQERLVADIRQGRNADSTHITAWLKIDND